MQRDLESGLLQNTLITYIISSYLENRNRLLFMDMVKILLSHIQVHKDKMAHASAHHEQMKDFMGAEILVFGVKNGQL